MSNAQQGTNYVLPGGTSLSAIVPILYERRDRVAREQIGLITAATRDATEDQAALGQVVRSPVTMPATPTDIVPSNVSPYSGGQTIEYKDLVIANSKSVPVQWTGEEQRAVGGQYEKILGDQFEQSFRGVGNLIEASLVSTMIAGTFTSTINATSSVNYGGASRAYGTAGTTPFGWSNSDYSAGMKAFGQLHLILDNNGTPEADRRLVLSQAAFANIRALPNLYKANEAGTDQMLREGIALQVEGFKFHKSNQLDKNKHLAGTGTGYLSDGTGAVTPSTYQVGETSIKLKTGTGTVLAGDVVSFAGDTNLYVVGSGVSAPGTITLAQPGLQQTLADGVAMTITSTFTANFALNPAALILAARMPIMPAGGDAASDVAAVYDPVSGLTYQIAEYRQYRQIHYETGAAWGSLANKSEFAALLLG